MSATYFVFLFLCALSQLSVGKKLPSFITRCKLSADPKTLGDCIQKVFDDNKEKFVQGIPEMHIPPLDPFHVDRVNFNTGNGTALGINAVFTNMNVTGTSESTLQKLEADIVNREAKLEIKIPHLSVNSDYTVTGRIMVMPINGSGKAQGNYSDIHAINRYKGELVKRNNKEYIKWTDNKIELSVGGGSIHFEDLFNGNKELTENTNKVINENVDVLIKELKPLVEETVSALSFSILKEVFHTYSIDELFEKE